jgi:hypothetical protein
MTNLNDLTPEALANLYGNAYRFWTPASPGMFDEVKAELIRRQRREHAMTEWANQRQAECSERWGRCDVCSAREICFLEELIAAAEIGESEQDVF